MMRSDLSSDRETQLQKTLSIRSDKRSKKYRMNTTSRHDQPSSTTNADAVSGSAASVSSTGATASAPVKGLRSRLQRMNTAAKATLVVMFAAVIGGLGFVAGLQTGKKSGTAASSQGQMGNFGSGNGYGRQMGPPSGSSGQMPSGGFPDQSGSSDSTTTSPQTTTN